MEKAMRVYGILMSNEFIANYFVNENKYFIPNLDGLNG